MAEPTCVIDACTKPARARRGMCYMHYNRVMKYGDPLFVKRILRDDVTRFWSKVSKTESCWEWIAGRKAEGYGLFHIGGTPGTNVGAHRYAYELLVGPIPAGLDLDHLCRNPPCVNPAHLEPVTHGENMRRGLIHVRRWDSAACLPGS